MPANFRSYEGQLRLLTAVIAAHPELRLNYKDIAKHYGSDWSVSGVEHFFRPIKKNGLAIQSLVKRGEDPANFNHNAGKAVAGAPSTPGGDKNAPKTPRHSGGRKRAAPSTGHATGSKKPKVLVKSENTYDGDEGSDNEHPPLDITPSRVLVDEDKTRAYEQMMADSAARVAPPDLAPAQAATPEDDDDDLKIVTPADVAHSFGPAQSFSTGPAGYHSNAFYGNADDEKSYEQPAFDEC